MNFARPRLQRVVAKLTSLYERSRLSSQDFVMVSNNCWGLEVYKALGRKYNTPFVGLYLYPRDYLKLLRNFEKLGNAAPVFVEVSRHSETPPTYPVGVVLDDVEIHFLHYESKEQAREKWLRRLERMQESVARGARILFKICDRDRCTLDDLAAFQAIPIVQSHRRISFGVQPLADPHHVRVTGSLCEKGGQVVDGLRLYKGRYALFDFPEWVVSGHVQRGLVSRAFATVQ